jgi:uncharacterized RDD family membrane protein YckC
MKKYPYTGKRIGATFIDYLLIWSLTFLYIIYFGDVKPDGTHVVRNMQVLPLFVLWFLYFVIGERFGGTLGHRIFRLKVVTMDGDQPDTWHTFLRRIFDLVDLFPFGLVGILLISNSRYNQRVGDMVAGTQVIGRDDTLNAIDFDFEKVA